jgi:GT2 family glycosyltransferase
MDLSAAETGSWWIDKPPSLPVDLTVQRVTAILVSRNGEAWLPAALEGLAHSTVRATEIVAVDNRSDDGSLKLLQAARRQGVLDQVLTGSATASYGEAVNAALELCEAGTEWIWLLHDDAVPDPTALEELLTLAVRTPGLAIAVPLLVRPARRRHTPLVLELGASIAGTGRRHLPIEAGEAAQGQYDPQAVLGGSTCGMLVKRTVFESLRGFSSAIPSYRDGVDLGWRVNLEGHVVMTCPEARLTHYHVGHSERRSGTIAQAKHRSEAAWDRLMGMRLVAAHSPGGPGYILTWLRLVLASVLRAIGFLLDKAPDMALDEWHAVGDFVRGRERIARLRRRILRIAPTLTDRQRADRLRPPWWSALIAFFHTLADLLRDLFGSSRGHELLLDDLLGDEFESRAAERRVPFPRWAFGVALVVLAIVAGRGLIVNEGPVRAARLLPAPPTLTDAFHLALNSPAGTTSIPAPWLLLEAIGSIVFIRPNWFIVAVLLIAVPATTVVAAWYLRRHLGQHKRMSWILALAYSLLPALVGGLNRGAIWLVVLALVLPFFVAWLQRWSDLAEGAKAWQPAAGIALSLALAIPVVPALWLPAAVAVSWSVIRSRDGLWSLIRGGLALVLPLVLWGDWLIDLFGTPGRLLTGPSPLLGDTTTTSAWQMLIGRAGVGGLPPMWLSAVVFGCLWLGAIVAVIRERSLALLGVAALVFLTIGVTVSRFAVTVDTSRVMPDASPWLLIAFAFLMAMVVAWLDAGSHLASQDFGVAQALIGAFSLVLTIATGFALVWWVVGGVGQVQRGDNPNIPYYLRVNEVEYGASSLIIDETGPTVTWALRSGGQPTWADGEMRTGALVSPEAWQMAERIVAQVSAGRFDEDMTAKLQTMGVRYILVTGASSDTSGVLEASIGLGRGIRSENGASVVWELNDQPTRTQVVGSEGLAVSLRPGETIAEIGPDSRLVLSQPPDPRVVVTVGGVRLDPVDSLDWRATYDLNQTTGEVAVTDPLGHRTWHGIQLVLGFLIVLFALPSAHARSGSSRAPRRARETEEAQ